MSSETVHSRTREGAAAFMALIKDVSALGDAHLERSADAADSGRDVRDYREMAALVGGAIHHHLTSQHPDHAQGFLRALTDLLCIVGDGFGPGDDWDPIRTTAQAFGEQLEAGAAHAERCISSDWVSYEMHGRRTEEPTFTFWLANGASKTFGAEDMRRDQWWEALGEPDARLIRARLYQSNGI